MISNIIRYHVKENKLEQKKPATKKYTQKNIILGDHQKSFLKKEEVFLGNFPTTFVNENENTRKSQLRKIIKENIVNKNTVVYFKNNFEENNDVLTWFKSLNVDFKFLDFENNKENKYSIDPLFMLLKKPVIINDLFGNALGELIFAITQEISENHSLNNETVFFNSQSIFDIIDLDNLLHIYEEKYLPKSSLLIKNYFCENLQIDLSHFSVIHRHNIEKHLINAVRGNLILKSIKHWEDKGVFSVEPNIDLIHIMNNESILFINTYTPKGIEIEPLSINDIISYNLICASQTSDNPYNNIILEDVLQEYYSEILRDSIFAQGQSKDRWMYVFSYFEPHEEETIKHIHESKSFILSNINSTFAKKVFTDKLNNIQKYIKKTQKDNDHFFVFRLNEDEKPALIKN